MQIAHVPTECWHKVVSLLNNSWAGCGLLPRDSSETNHECCTND